MNLLIPVGVTLDAILLFVLIIVANRQIRRVLDTMEQIRRDIEELKSTSNRRLS